MKQTIKGEGGAKRKVAVPHIGTVRWDGSAGNMDMVAASPYEPIVEAVACLMLVADQLGGFITPNAVVYPSLVNPDTIVVKLTLVGVNLGELPAHRLEFLRERIAALSTQADMLGFFRDVTLQEKSPDEWRETEKGEPG